MVSLLVQAPVINIGRLLERADTENSAIYNEVVDSGLSALVYDVKSMVDGVTLAFSYSSP